jgi:hypothetical protein
VALALALTQALALPLALALILALTLAVTVALTVRLSLIRRGSVQARAEAAEEALHAAGSVWRCRQQP